MTPAYFLAARTLVHVDGGRDHDAPNIQHNGGMEETVEHGLTGTNEAKLPVSANLTCRYADNCAASITAVVVTGIECHPCPSASSSTQKTLCRSQEETKAETLTSIRQCGGRRVA